MKLNGVLIAAVLIVSGLLPNGISAGEIEAQRYYSDSGTLFDEPCKAKSIKTLIDEYHTAIGLEDAEGADFFTASTTVTARNGDNPKNVKANIEIVIIGGTAMMTIFDGNIKTGANGIRNIDFSEAILEFLRDYPAESDGTYTIAVKVKPKGKKKLDSIRIRTGIDYRMNGSRCGDGVVDDFETCDDGNRINGDGCSVICLGE